MTLEVHSTKAWHNLPCGHAQYFDKNEDGSPGHCASIHGYDRTVRMTFSGHVDENGWIVPFGGLKPVKEFLEYYFDHVTVLPADDPRLEDIPKGMWRDPAGLLATLRVLPYGVSMEMSSLFVWEQVNPFIYNLTDGRCYVSKVECVEHDRNSAFVTVDRETATNQARKAPFWLAQIRDWSYVEPETAINEINKG